MPGSRGVLLSVLAALGAGCYSPDLSPCVADPASCAVADDLRCREGETRTGLGTDFSMEPAHWRGGRYADEGVTVEFAGGRMQVTLPGFEADERTGGFDTASDQEFVERRVAVQMAQAPQDEELLLFLRLHAPGPGFQDYASVMLRNRTMYAVLVIAGARWEGPSAYDPDAARFWQLRETLGNLHYEVSADGVDFVELARRPTPDFLHGVALDLGVTLLPNGDPAPEPVAFEALEDCRLDP